MLVAHYPVFCIALFLLFLAFCQVTQEFQSPLKLKEGLLVGFFLGGLVILGSQQSWWLQPLISDLGDLSLFLGATALTAVTDNAALTYLGTLVPHLNIGAKHALVSGAVVGGGLTIIANAPNPIGHEILNRTFGKAGMNAWLLFKAALLPTFIAGLCFWFL